MRLNIGGGLSVSQVPQDEFLVITDACKQMAIMAVPGHILDDLSVRLEGVHRVYGVVELVRLVDIPDAYESVIRAREQLSSVFWVPCQTESLLLVALQAKIRLDLVIGGFCRVFEVVKDVDFSTDGLSGDYVVALRHVSRSVDLSLMVDLSLNLNALVLLRGASNSVSILSVVLVVASVFGGLKGDFNLSEM